MLKKILIILIAGLSLPQFELRGEDGYRLWLRYELIADNQKLAAYRKTVQTWHVSGTSPTMQIIRNELPLALTGLLGTQIKESAAMDRNGLVILGKASAPELAEFKLNDKVKAMGAEGFVIVNATSRGKNVIVITGNEDVGVLYGMFHFLRLLQTNADISHLAVENAPKIKRRILNHWDNLDRTVERGYAGMSIFDWHKLPGYLEDRYTDYARANASIGINGAVVTNVNANALALTPDYLKKFAALADVFRPFGIKIYLTARFSAPIDIGGMKTADPLDETVRTWWKDKAAEIYRYIPDFGGFLVKANSEGQPGPQNYGRTHADGANMLAAAVKPFNGIVMWRAFVYDNNVPDDRAKQAYAEFKPLDGAFDDNVMVQVKNGAVDFQPREPFHPLFGSMPKTPLMMEFQITQEYLGFSTHLVFLPSFYSEVLNSDTYVNGNGSTVSKIIDGSLEQHKLSGMAGVANIGSDRNWTGHPFGQSNWYGFGRLAWDPAMTPATIADEWTRMTFSNDAGVVRTIKAMMLSSHEAAVNYMTPLGLHHIMGYDHHYGPGPWVKDKGRADWTSVYYHRADSLGVGFDRTASGSNALGQYSPAARREFSLPHCPDKYLLWFHHVRWDYKMRSGRTLWDELCYKYDEGVSSVKQMQQSWQSMSTKIDAGRFKQVTMLLAIQEEEARRWRNSCILYFQTFSGRPIPAGLAKPEHNLEYYENLSFPFAPGIRPKW
jgi:alpha-glucuronidase